MGMRARQRNERKQKQAWKRVRNSTGPEKGQIDERNQNGHEILPKSRIRKMSKRGGGQKRAREMNEIETGMKYCRGAEYGERQKSLNISYY